MNSKRLNIRELRKAARMSLEELSALIGLSRQALANYEKGVTEPSEETLNRIGKALGMTKEQMYKESQNDDWQGKYVALLEKYNHLLENMAKVNTEEPKKTTQWPPKHLN